MSWLPFLLVELALVAFFVFGWFLWHRRQKQKSD
jgi:uncharacterized protein YneF (UPF0154 family)